MIAPAKKIARIQPSHGVKANKKKIKKRPTGTCFILMPFKEPFDTYYNSIIKPAVITAGLEPLRGDSLFRPSPIMADVWKMIQDAKALVAELTEKNANVFYELGLSHAIGKPVILLSETMDDVPFDLQPLRVILYNKNHPAWGNKLRTTLVASLEETLSDAVGAVPSMFRKAVKSQAPGESESSLRLAVLERQVAALREKEFSPSNAMEIRFSNSTIDVIRNELIKSASDKESAEIMRKWIRRGLRNNEARGIIQEVLPPAIAIKVLQYLGIKL